MSPNYLEVIIFTGSAVRRVVVAVERATLSEVITLVAVALDIERVEGQADFLLNRCRNNPGIRDVVVVVQRIIN